MCVVWVGTRGMHLHWLQESYHNFNGSKGARSYKDGGGGQIPPPLNAFIVNTTLSASHIIHLKPNLIINLSA